MWPSQWPGYSRPKDAHEELGKRLQRAAHNDSGNQQKLQAYADWQQSMRMGREFTPPSQEQLEQEKKDMLKRMLEADEKSEAEKREREREIELQRRKDAEGKGGGAGK